MIQASSDDADWVHTKSSVGAEDHTLLGKCRGQSGILSVLKSQLLSILSSNSMEEISKMEVCLILSDFPDAGYSMHFSTMVGKPHESALLESRTLYPKRKLKCLQFFYKMTGSPKDRLVIWVKMDDGTGTIRRMKKIHTFYGRFIKWACLWRTHIAATTLTKCFASRQIFI